MKTNPAARRFVRIRFIMICLAVAALAVFEVGLGELWAVGINRSAALRTDMPQAPSVSISDLMIAAR